MVHYVCDLPTVLKELGCLELLVLDGQNTDSGAFHKGATFEGIQQFTVNKNLLFPILQNCRVTKTPHELDLLRYACRISAEAHIEVMKAVLLSLHKLLLTFPRPSLVCLNMN